MSYPYAVSVLNNEMYEPLTLCPYSIKSLKYEIFEICVVFFGFRSLVAQWLVLHAATPQDLGLIPGLVKIDSAFHPLDGSIK